MNLSGIETACLRIIGKGTPADAVSRALMIRTGEALGVMASQISAACNTGDILFAGGVSASSYIRKMLEKTDPGIVFGKPSLSSDNAVGTALLGRMRYAAEADKSK